MSTSSVSSEPQTKGDYFDVIYRVLAGHILQGLGNHRLQWAQPIIKTQCIK